MHDPHMYYFGSDNCSGIHPRIWEAIASANQGNTSSYGGDPWTISAIAKFEEQFGKPIKVYFVFNGTAANVLSVKAMLLPFQAVVCAKTAHLATNECGAPEAFAGCKLITVPSPDGKITVEALEAACVQTGSCHEVQPKVISVSQVTEFGTVYTPEEIRKITDFAHRRGMLVHMDGARLSVAAASLKTSLRAITTDVGVDVLSFGGTKNGLLMGEAVVFLNAELAKNFEYTQKQGMQLASKMRFISAQFDAFLTNDLWRECGDHANKMTQLLFHQIKDIPSIVITQKVQTNAIFAKFPLSVIDELRPRFNFSIWNKRESEVRCMTAFNTAEESVRTFANAIAEAASLVKMP